MIEEAERNPTFWDADELATELVISFAKRQAQGLTTIGSTDIDKAGREQRQAEKSKERSTARRRKSGAIPRAEYLAKAESRTQPWITLGISKRTYQRCKAQAAKAAD